LSEDCWLLFCRGFGRSAESIEFRAVQRFRPTKHPPDADRSIAIDDWKQWGYRLRPFLLPTAVMDLYRSIVASPQAHRLSDLARISIGYVTGANDFFHLRPILADQLSIPRRFLVPAVRNGRDLCGRVITSQTVETWRAENRPNFLLRLRPQDVLPEPVRSYLDSRPGRDARETYKCRNRSPWYAVPDVRAPDGFLSYMSGVTPSLVANPAGCVAANSVHVVHMRAGKKIDGLQHAWGDPVTQLSCEIEGHPLGGGMLKVEPREAGQIVVRQGGPRSGRESDALMEATLLMRSWRHNG
jgi:adenine-specific DNA-methyltransferase